jgi:acetyl esterase
MICPDSLDASALTIRAITVTGAQGPLDARLYCPAAPATGGNTKKMKQLHPGLIVFFHAGGFICGSLDEADRFSRALAVACGVPVLSSTYTLAGQLPFPAAAEDAHAVLCWARKHAKKLGWDGTHLVSAGIEAGGNLAAVAALIARDRGQPTLAAQILMMPMLDPGLNSGSMRAMCDKPQVAGVAAACDRSYRDYLPRAADRTHPYASPLHSSRLKGLPAALILSTEDDPLRDEAETYADMLQAAANTAWHRRLPTVPLQDGVARSACARQGVALQEILIFLAAMGIISAASGPPTSTRMTVSPNLPDLSASP